MKKYYQVEYENDKYTVCESTSVIPPEEESSLIECWRRGNRYWIDSGLIFETPEEAIADYIGRLERYAKDCWQEYIDAEDKVNRAYRDLRANSDERV